MKNGIAQIGLDVGNYDTKTQSTSIVSGFTKYLSKPFTMEEYIVFERNYYVSDGERFPYLKDKTTNENLFILSAFGIAKEILFNAEKQNRRKEDMKRKDPSRNINVLGVQGEIDKITTIDLGIGLPPTHMSSLMDKTIDYYKAHFSNGVLFTYQDYSFNLKLRNIECYPQDYAVLAAFNRKDPKNASSIITLFPSYYAVDIGGWTVDVVTIVNNKPVITMCDSKALGVLAMFAEIIRKVEEQTGIRPEQEDIEAILMNKPTIFDQKIIDLVTNETGLWFEKIVNTLTQFGLQFDVRPVVFLGGGAQLFKPYIKKANFKKYEIIPGTNTNAQAYYKLISQTK